ncbi:leukotriene B4 receptor 1-like [Megalops cyprinoides]|uniref:leukotriene B4 receptor 1-like n=1 Tax=Megalops cyprinoides TaxID=118141 RepID=UPI001864260E|nr:leukotriene B4 receptor 1-like [Megalops cyprinoides]
MQRLNASSSNSTSWTPSPENLVSCMFLGLCFVVGALGNGLVAWAILRHLRRASLTVKLMLNLALTDILSLGMVIPWMVALLKGWPYGRTACKLLSYLVYCGLYSSVLTVTLMSLQRSLLVMYPHCKTWLRPGGRGERALVGGLWALACLLATPAAVLRDLEESQEAGGHRLSCRPQYSSVRAEVAVLAMETLLGFVIPGAVLACSYLCIVRRVERLPFASSRRVSRLVTWVVSAFFLFWCPWHIFNLLQVAAALKGAEQGVGLRGVARRCQNVAGALTFLNSALNPFLYALASRSLRGTNSLMQRVERICHSRLTDTPESDSRKASLCTQTANVTVATTTHLCPGQVVTPV